MEAITYSPRCEQTMLRVWVNTETPLSWNVAYDGMKALYEDIREIWEYHSIGEGKFQIKTIYSNKSCMRNIEVSVMDEGVRRLI